MVATAASSQQHGIWFVIAAVAYFVYRLLSSARTEARRRREQGQPGLEVDSPRALKQCSHCAQFCAHHQTRPSATDCHGIAEKPCWTWNS